MGQKDKLIKRLKSHPKDFTFDEAETLLKYLSYSRSDNGKTSGSLATSHQMSLNNFVETAIRKQLA